MLYGENVDSSGIGFVILHYMAEEMTICAVNNIIRLYPKSKIVIVDNGSTNKTGIFLKKYYLNNENIFVLINSKNLGFAKGNNIGFKFLKENFALDFIVVANNDILFDQNDLPQILYKKYNETGFGILGPDILALSTGKHQNPLRYREYTYKQLLHIKSHLKRDLFIYPIYFLFNIFKKQQSAGTNEINDELMNVVLHGAVYVFSRDYINVRENCFCERTFLYFEEDILFEECKEQSFCILYTPEIKVFHLEDISTNIAIKGKYKQLKFKLKNMYESINVLLEIKGKETKKI